MGLTNHLSFIHICRAAGPRRIIKVSHTSRYAFDNAGLRDNARSSFVLRASRMSRGSGGIRLGMKKRG